MEDLGCAMQSNSKDYSQCKDLYCAEDYRYPDELQRALRSLYGIQHVYAGVERDLSVYVVPRFPDNHNPLLSIALQKKLDEMSPREYLTYVLRELTLEERESLMVDERQRRKTFLVNWPRENSLSGVEMAQAGFYCVDDYDRAQCVFCRGILHEWESGDNPMTEHARFFKFCHFVKDLECGNREYRRNVLSPEELRYISFFGNPDMERNQDGSVSMFFPDCGIFTSKADQIEYKNDVPSPEELKKISYFGTPDMLRLCLRFGHAPDDILKAVKLNKKPFDTVGKFFEAIDAVQEGQENANLRILQSVPLMTSRIFAMKNLCKRCRRRSQKGNNFICHSRRHRKLINIQNLTESNVTPVSEKQNYLLRHNKSFPLLLDGRRGHVNRDLDSRFSKRSCPMSRARSRSKTDIVIPPPVCDVQKAKVQLNPRNIMEDLSCEMQSNSKDYSQCKDLYCAEDYRYTDELQKALTSPYGIQHVYAGVERDLTVNVVARFPDNHNPLLPIALQKKLDEMSPREYLTYVLRELTLEERESLMVDERQRRKTYLVNWPRENSLSGVKMAQAGFYCVDDYDRVQCVFCRGSLHKWESGDNPMTEHARSFNFCRFVKGLECGNREYRGDVLSPEDLKNIHFFGEPEMKKNRDGSISTDSSTLGISTNKADMIRYAPDATRLKTFGRWPADCPITPKRMCEAGFYFTGFEDQVRCFFCSGGLKKWQATDDPWEEHARWFPECSLLVQQKGEGFVNDIHSKTPANKKVTKSTVQQRKQADELKQQKTDQQEMTSICLRLGHAPEAVLKAVELNRKPFDTIGTFIEAIYAVQDGQEIDTVDYDQQMGAGNLLTTKAVMAEADIARAALEIDSVPFRPGSMDCADSYPKTEGACIMCYRKIRQTIAAKYIGLPCGHMLYCEKCNKEEVQRAADPRHKPRCLYLNCGTVLTGTFKTFYA